MYRITNSLLAVLFSFVACSNKPMTAAEILERYFNAVSGGDPTRWDRLKLVYIESGTTNPESQEKPAIHKQYLILPDLQRVDEVKNGVSVIYSIYRDHTFYAAPPAGMPDMPRIPPIAIPQQSPPIVFETRQLAEIMKRSKATELIGLTTLNGKTAYEITFQLQSVVWRYYFDAENFTALKAVQEGPNMKNIIQLSDYRTIDGLSIPMKIESWTNRGPIKDHRIEVRTTIDFHPKIDLNAFDIPQDWK